MLQDFNKIISFCTCCKGRLWQLKHTLPHNIKYITKEIEIIILDYQSNDGLIEWLYDNYKTYIEDNRIKLISLSSDEFVYNYSSAFAKNVCHKQAGGKVLMNLDCDQFIDHNTINDLINLPPNNLYIPQVTQKSSGQFGRLGYSKDLFYSLKGYDETLIGLKGDDTFLRIKTRKLNIQHTIASSYYPCIENTYEEKYRYVNLENGINPPLNYPSIWGEFPIYQHI